VEGYPLEPVPALVGPSDTRLAAWIAELGLRDALLPAKPVVTAFAGATAARHRAAHAERRRADSGIGRLAAWRLVRLPRLLARYGPALALGAAAEAEQIDDRSLADFARLYFGRRSSTAGWLPRARARSAT
jgi:hypothetical protein